MNCVCRISNQQTPTTLGEQYYNMYALLSLKKLPNVFVDIGYNMLCGTTPPKQVNRKNIGESVVNAVS